MICHKMWHHDTMKKRINFFIQEPPVLPVDLGVVGNATTLSLSPAGPGLCLLAQIPGLSMRQSSFLLPAPSPQSSLLPLGMSDIIVI